MSPRIGSMTLLASALLMGGGCGVTVDPITVAEACPDQPIRGPLEYADEPIVQLISDFESGTTNLTPVGGRDGAWVLGTDLSSVSLIYEPSGRCVGRGRWSGHFLARGFTSWGANWTAVFRSSSTATAYDGSRYSGISFWAAIGGGSIAPQDVPVGIVTMDTAWNSSICDPCTDHYMAKVTLTSRWERKVVPFSEMAQSGRGSPLLPMRKDQMVGFIIWPTQSFDLWIDDVRFEP
jgi:hypothetical protein